MANTFSGRRRPDRQDDTSRTSRGFGLIELMVVVVIVAIFAVLAAPSFRTLIAKQRVKSESSALVESLWIARSEAIKLNSDVGFLFTSPEAGWSVKVGTTVLHSHDGASGVAATIISGDESVQFTFNAYGRLVSGTGAIQLGVASADVYRCVTVSASGRATSKEGTCA